jgi:hypothetical protein
LLGKYNIILFKNNKKKKLIKTYCTEISATKKFKHLIEKNKDIIFHKEFENAEDCEFYLSIITNQTKIQKSLFITDDLGRNKPVFIQNPEYVFLDIKEYKVEETIYDWSTNTKINFLDLIEKYCSKKDLKSIFTLNNKLCIQIDENINLFSLKNKSDSERLLQVMEKYFMDNGRSDAFFVRDISSAQRKWTYKLLEDKGYDKNKLYRLKTTFSKR